MFLCVARENPNGCGETKLQDISLWLCGLLTCPNLCCDLTCNKHSRVLFVAWQKALMRFCSLSVKKSRRDLWIGAILQTSFLMIWVRYTSAAFFCFSSSFIWLKKLTQNISLLIFHPEFCTAGSRNYFLGNLQQSLKSPQQILKHCQT